MFKEYYGFYEYCSKIKDINDSAPEVYEKWKELSKQFFSFFDTQSLIDGLVSLYTSTDSELGETDIDKLWANFVASLEYYSDRMNLNRWVRLQLLIVNIFNINYSKKL